MVEDAPVVVLDQRERARTRSTKLRLYTFAWEEPAVAVALGFGSLYNYSSTPNLAQVPVLDELLLRFTAVRDIEAGEELTHDYGYDPVQSEAWYRRRFYREEQERPSSPSPGRRRSRRTTPRGRRCSPT